MAPIQQRKIKICASLPLDRDKLTPVQCTLTQEDWDLASSSHHKWIWLTAIDYGAMASQLSMDLSKAIMSRAEAAPFFCITPVMLEKRVGKQMVEVKLDNLHYSDGQATVLLQTIVMSVGEPSTWWVPLGCAQAVIAENIKAYKEGMALKSLKARKLFLAWDIDGSGELEFGELRAVRDWFQNNVPGGVAGFNLDSLWEALPAAGGIDMAGFEKWLLSTTASLEQEVFDELELRIKQFISSLADG